MPRNLSAFSQLARGLRSRRSSRHVPSWLLPRLAGESELDHRTRHNEQYFSEQVVWTQLTSVRVSPEHGFRCVPYCPGIIGW
jgi:hypothetical protein